MELLVPDVVEKVASLVQGGERALRHLLNLLNSHKKTIRKETCWVISNITAGSADQIQEVIDMGLIPPLLVLSAKGSLDMKKEAAWAIANATCDGTLEQIRYLVKQDFIPLLCKLLTGQEDTNIVKVTLRAIENILKRGKMQMEAAGSEVNEFASLFGVCHAGIRPHLRGPRAPTRAGRDAKI